MGKNPAGQCAVPRVRGSPNALQTLVLFAISVAGTAFVAGCANSSLSSAFADVGKSVNDSFAVKVPFLTMPRSAEAGSLRSIVIVPASQPLAQQMATELESSIVKLRMNEQPYYSNAKLEQAARVPMLTEAQLLAAARQSGTQGAIGLSSAAVDVKVAPSREDRFVCSVETKLFQVCPKERLVKRQVACAETQAVANAQVRVVRTADTRTVLTETMVGSAKVKRCDGDKDGPVDRNQLAHDAMTDLVANVMKGVAPSIEMRPLDLMSADARLPAEMHKGFDAAQEFARGKRIDEACSRFAELYDNFKESVALTYNVAFCSEARGDLLRASQGYRRASELANAPDTQIDRRLAGVEKTLRESPVAFMADLPPTSAGVSGITPAAAAANGKRVALVVGNARYQRSALINPVNDARLVGERLNKIGFDVTVIENADSARFGTAVRDFTTRAKGADTALFYYAGHAIQSEGENILMPVDNLKMRSAEDVRDHGGVALGSVMAQLDVAHPRVKLVILDACRDNPLPATSRGIGGGGLAAVKQAPEGALIVFATAPGRTAEDGTGKNSVFTKHFVATLSTPNLKVEDLFKRVREAVRKETGNRQEPMELNSLVGDVILVRNP